MEEGNAIVAECATSAEEKALAQAAVELAQRAGGACKQPVLGILGSPNAAEQVPVKKVAALTAAWAAL